MKSFLDGKVTLYPGNCLDRLDGFEANAFDACVTDPPYHLASIVKRFGGDRAAEAKDYSGDPSRPQATGAFARASRGFMGKQWDGGQIAFEPATWARVLRVLKPGGHIVAFAAAKNVGHLQVAIEAAGFEVRDCILDMIDLDPMLAAFVGSLNDAQRAALFRLIDEGHPSGGLLAWLFGSGFPKNHNVALDYEKRLCDRVERDGREVWVYRADGADMVRVPPFRDPDANAWAGFGTALKPAFEPIVIARKPLDGTVAENVLKWGTGALNIDACRIATSENLNGGAYSQGDKRQADATSYYTGTKAGEFTQPEGRWPANVIHDGSDAATRAFPDTQSGELLPHHRKSGAGLVGSGTFAIRDRTGEGSAPFGGDAGSASRFFYSAKADSDDRLGSKHPTVKPVDLMQWLVRLVTAPGQTVIDPFAGTGTTGEAAWREGRRAVLIEREAEYQADIARRMKLCLAGPDERAREAIKAKTKDKPVDAGPLFGGSA